MQLGWHTQAVSHNNSKQLNSTNSERITNPLNGIKTTKTKKLPHLLMNLDQPNIINPINNQNQIMNNPNQMVNPNQSTNPMMNPTLYSQINQNQAQNMNNMNINNMNNMNSTNMNMNPMNMNSMNMNPMNVNSMNMNPMNMNSMNMNSMNMNTMNNMNSMNMNPMNMNSMNMNPMNNQMQMMQQSLIQQQLLQQQILQNQILSQQIMSQAMNQMNQNNQQNSHISQNNDFNQSQDPNNLDIFFKVRGYGSNSKLIKIKSRNDEMVYELIDKYRETTGDYETKNKFIYNAKELKPNLTCYEAGLTYGAIVQVINTRHVDGGNLFFYYFNKPKK